MTRLAFAKPEPRKRAKARRKRQAARVVTTVRANVAVRDGYCRLASILAAVVRVVGACAGPSEWAHFGAYKRARTRGRPPTERHTTAGSLMLCKRHHVAYDEGRLRIEARTARGCDGPLAYTTDKGGVDEST